ncbi:AraC family transcriptional regulator [Lachnospiraceae bacterium NSJ-143]|nr:AraC family transcriptional regulator [Lachnospiraceae bacterium NSJ-143]
MDWLNNWNSVVRYIEEHLDSEIDTEYMAEMVCCSPFHFQRMFSYITDMSLSEYIRRRRMSRAASDLQSGASVIDTAVMYGYDSPTAFNRAFRSVHGIAPSKAKEKGIQLKAYPPLSFSITVKGEVEMNYRIESKKEFRIVGRRHHFTGGIDESFKKAPDIWLKAQNDTIPVLCRIIDTEVKGVLGVCTMAAAREFDYYIAVVSDKPVPEGMEEYTVPAADWAVFECVGPMPQSVQNMQKRIALEWFPTSGYKYANAPDVELYCEGDIKSEDYRCEIWIPVVKK